MQQSKLDRINELARIAKERTLNEQEKEEQQQLRQEYIAVYRKNLRAQLDNLVLVDEYGKHTAVKDRRKES